MSDEAKYDVVIYKLDSGAIDSFAGRNLPMSRGEGSYSQSAEKRVDTVVTRLNDDYHVAIVAAGKFKEGDKITAADHAG